MWIWYYCDQTSTLLSTGLLLQEEAGEYTQRVDMKSVRGYGPLREAQTHQYGPPSGGYWMPRYASPSCLLSSMIRSLMLHEIAHTHCNLSTHPSAGHPPTKVNMAPEAIVGVAGLLTRVMAVGAQKDPVVDTWYQRLASRAALHVITLDLHWALRGLAPPMVVALVAGVAARMAGEADLIGDVWTAGAAAGEQHLTIHLTLSASL